MRFNKKVIILVAFVSLFLTVLTIQDTYSKYISAVEGSSDMSIARWKILLNNFDVKNELVATNLITPVFEGSAYIAEGVIAPTAVGYFDVVIDGTDTDVAYQYTMTINNDENSLVDDIEIVNCYIDNVLTTITNNTVTNTVSLNDTRVNTVRVYVRWKDGSGETMNNAADTETTKNANPVATLNVSINFVQVSS